MEIYVDIGWTESFGRSKNTFLRSDDVKHQLGSLANIIFSPFSSFNLSNDLLHNALKQQTTNVFLTLSSSGDEGSSRPVSPPRPPQLPPRPPLPHAPVLAGRSGGQAGVRIPPVLIGPAHQAPRLPEDGAEQVRGRKAAGDSVVDGG